MSSSQIEPPIAKREEDRVVLAGVLPKAESSGQAEGQVKELIRQSESSTNKLLNPARPIPDPYGWLRDEPRTDPAVLDHLKAENEYTKQTTQHLESLRQTLYDEMVASIQETDYTTPTPRNGKYWYYSRTNKGQSYKIYCRAKMANADDNDNNECPKIEWDGQATTPILSNEEVYLNINTLAKDKSYCSVSSATISPTETQNLLAYTVDYTGDEIYSLYVKDIEKDKIVDHDPSIECSGSVVWGNDSKTLYYVKMDDAHRPFQVYRRILSIDDDDNDKKQEDELLFEQLDDLYWTSIDKSSDYRYLFISTSSSETSEVHYIDLHDDGNNTSLKCIAPKRTKVLYDVEHYNGHWIITSNVDETPNMRLMSCPVSDHCEKDWKDMSMTDDAAKLFDGGYQRSLDGVEAFDGYLVASGREGGIPRVWVMEPSKSTSSSSSGNLTIDKSTQLIFDEDAYDVGVGANYDYVSDKLTLYYDSLTTPLQSLQIIMRDPNNKETRTVLKQKNVPGYKKEEYGCDRITVTVRDGTDVPVSMVYCKEVMKEFVSSGKTMPVHLVGYGSYGACSEADFSATRLSLMKRGIIYVMAHVRGGGEMGRQWYEEPNGAKYLCKENTFNDFCDVAKWLIQDKKLTTPKQLSCEGRSAGGLLIGASINQCPDLFGVAILGVPFVDVVCTMTDSSIPLTCGEWEEWGNPNEEKFFDYMMGYSPMNNVKGGVKYPSCLLTGGLHDPRVQYWEPAKFAAELRHKHDKNASGPVCLKIDMSAGHFSASDRYKYLSELSFDYAFLLDQLGLHHHD